MSEREVQDLLQKASNSNDDDALNTLESAIKKCESDNVDANLYCKVRILKGDILLKKGKTQEAVEEYKKASELDERDGKIDSPELQSKLNSLINNVTDSLQRDINNNTSNSNERDLSSLLLSQIAGASGSNSSKLGMLSTLMGAASGSSGNGQSSGGASGLISLVQHLSSSGVNAQKQQQSGGFNVGSLMSMAQSSGLMGGSSGSSGSGGMGALAGAAGVSGLASMLLGSSSQGNSNSNYGNNQGGQGNNNQGGQGNNNNQGGYSNNNQGYNNNGNNGNSGRNTASTLLNLAGKFFKNRN